MVYPDKPLSSIFSPWLYLRKLTFTFTFRGTAVIQIGHKTIEVNGNNDPTLVIIPGNTPHQITNRCDEPVMFFYYFPEQVTFEEDISYYFPCGEVAPPGSDWLASRECDAGFEPEVEYDQSLRISN